MKYAIVKDSLVTNIVEWDGSSEYNADGELIQADANAWIGGEYNGSFVARPTEPDNSTYAEKRKAEYPTTDELVVALWEAVIEERMASSIDLQGKRTAIKEKYPK